MNKNGVHERGTALQPLSDQETPDNSTVVAGRRGQKFAMQVPSYAGAQVIRTMGPGA